MYMLGDHMKPVPYKVRGTIRLYMWGTIHTCGGDHMIHVPYKVRGTIRCLFHIRHRGTITVIDSYKVPAVDSNHEDTSH